MNGINKWKKEEYEQRKKSEKKKEICEMRLKIEDGQRSVQRRGYATGREAKWEWKKKEKYLERSRNIQMTGEFMKGNERGPKVS